MRQLLTIPYESVKKAKELGTVKIVSFDWIEDSLYSRTKRPKPEEPYLWKNLLRAETEEQPWLQKHARKSQNICPHDQTPNGKITDHRRAYRGPLEGHKEHQGQKGQQVSPT